jgi:glycoprotein-N-acetylgalactosamine 3-beta-galactosyltransferase
MLVWLLEVLPLRSSKGNDHGPGRPSKGTHFLCVLLSCRLGSHIHLLEQLNPFAGLVGLFRALLCFIRGIFGGTPCGTDPSTAGARYRVLSQQEESWWPKWNGRITNGDLKDQVLPVDNEFCSSDRFGFNPVLDKTVIMKSDPLHPKILCFVNTIEEFHTTKVKAVMDTWGSKCDKLVFASSVDDESIGAFKVPNTSFEYSDLWAKHRNTLRIIWERYGDEYEWFFKADDDTFVIVENLRAYLASDDVQELHRQGEPLHIGNAVAMWIDEDDELHDGSRKVHDTQVWNRFLKRTNRQWVFNVGGAGYVMNQAFLRSTNEWTDSRECAPTKDIADNLDDALLSLCSSNFGAYPFNKTRDALGRERFHQESPALLYNLKESDDLFQAYTGGKKLTGGFQTGEDCCSSMSITFHHLTPDMIRAAYAKLYDCRDDGGLRVVSTAASALRNEEDWPPIATLNRIADEKRRVVVIPVNCGYVEFADNLVASMMKFNVTNFVFVPYDETAYRIFLKTYPDNVIPPMPGSDVNPGTVRYDSDKFQDMNRMRPNLLRWFVHRELTFLYLDSDTVWRSNLLDVFDEARHVDEGEPVDAVFTFDNSDTFTQVCSCMIYMTPTEDNMAFLKAWNDGWTAGRDDDQKVMNRVLSDYQQPFSYRVLDRSDGVLSGKQFFELASEEEQRRALIVHNNWIVGKSAKLARFEDASLWNPSGRLDGVRYDCDAGTVSRVEGGTFLHNYVSANVPVEPAEHMSKEAALSKSNRTLVVLIGSVRGGEGTWKSLYEHLLDPNQADLALMLGKMPDWSASLYNRAKFVWEFDEYDDWSSAVDEAFDITSFNSMAKWRALAKATAPNGPFGGTNEDPTSSGVINLLARHFVLEKLVELKLLAQYDHFVITRTDQFYPCPLYMDSLDSSKIWVPSGEDWGGICDRFMIANKDDIHNVLGLLKPAVLEPERYSGWYGNIESFVKLRLEEEGVMERVGRFRRSMFTASVEGDSTRWEKPRRPALLAGHQTIRYKYGDEYFQAMTSCGFE